MNTEEIGNKITADVPALATTAANTAIAASVPALATAGANAAILAKGSCVKMASKTGVNGAAVAATNLTFESGITLATHMPVYAVIKFGSGVLGIGVIGLLADTVPVIAAMALLTLLTGKVCVAPAIAALAIPSDASKFLKADVTTASLAASTFDIVVYGVPY